MIIDFCGRDLKPTNTLNIPTQFVPRVGETFTLEHPVGHFQTGTEMLIFDVTYDITDRDVIPHVRCYEAKGRTARRSMLKRNGWLKPDAK
jgi:hypothetical protein